MPITSGLPLLNTKEAKPTIQASLWLQWVIVSLKKSLWNFHFSSFKKDFEGAF